MVESVVAKGAFLSRKRRVCGAVLQSGAMVQVEYYREEEGERRGERE